MKISEILLEFSWNDFLGSNWWYIDIGWSYDLVWSGNMSLPEPMLTKIYDIIDSTIEEPPILP